MHVSPETNHASNMVWKSEEWRKEGNKMKGKTVLFLAILAYLFLLCSCKNIDYQDEQKQLAISLGVNIDDYPNKSVFPIGYFSAILKKEMGIDEVHKLVTGYTKVFDCSGSEFYMYFSEDEKKSLHFMIFYDHDKKHFSFIQGDDKEDPIQTSEGCISGKIKE